MPIRTGFCQSIRPLSLKELLTVMLVFLALPALSQVSIQSIDTGALWPARRDRWQPITVILRNDGDTAMVGMLELALPRNALKTVENRYRIPVVVPPNTRHSVSTLAAHRTSNSNITATLYDDTGIPLDTSSSDSFMGSAVLAALVLDRTAIGSEVLFDRFLDVGDPYGYVQATMLDPVNLPQRIHAYDGIDLVLVGQIDPAVIPPTAAETLQRFVRRGGKIIIIPGVHADAYRGTFLAEMMPVEPVGYRAIERIEALEKFSGVRMQPTGFIDFCEAIPRQGANVDIGGSEYPVVVSWPYGLGSVTFMACRLDSFGKWDGRQALRRVLFERPGGAFAKDSTAFHRHGRHYAEQLVGRSILRGQTLALTLGVYVALLLVALTAVRRYGHGEWGVALSLPLAVAVAVFVTLAGRGEESVGDTHVSIAAIELYSGGTEGRVRSLMGYYADTTRNMELIGKSNHTVYDQVTGGLTVVRCPYCEEVFEATAADFNARHPCHSCGSRFIVCRNIDCGKTIAVTEKFSAASGRVCTLCGAIPTAPDAAVTAPRTLTVTDAEPMVVPRETVRPGTLLVFAADGWAAIDGSVSGSVRLTRYGLEGSVSNDTGIHLIDSYVVWNDLVVPIGDLPNGQSAELRSEGFFSGRPELTATTLRDASARLRMQTASDMLGVDEPPALTAPSRPVFVGWTSAGAALVARDDSADWDRHEWTMLMVALDVEPPAGDSVRIPVGVIPPVLKGSGAKRFFVSPTAEGVFHADQKQRAGGYRSYAPESEGQADRIEFVFPVHGHLDRLRPQSMTLSFDADFRAHHVELDMFNVNTQSYDALPYQSVADVPVLDDYYDPATKTVRFRMDIRRQPVRFGEPEMARRYWTIRRIGAAFDATGEPSGL